MNFNSAGFALFFLVVAAVYLVCQVTRRHRLQNIWLLAASYYFYGAWDHRFLFLIIVSTAVDYSAGLGIVGRSPTRRAWGLIAASLAVSSVLLCAPLDWVALGQLLPGLATEAGSAPPVSTGTIFDASGTWSPFFGAIAASCAVLVACAIGTRVSGSSRRRYFLLLSLISNLALLGFFKYFDFFVDSAGTLLAGIGVNADAWLLGIAVPVGISFYTFQTLSYSIDIYRGELEPTEDVINFALFVAFFPQLVAGPIERARVLLPQLEKPRPLDWRLIQAGAYLIGWGLFKKILIADNMSSHVAEVFGADPSTLSGPVVLLGTYAFAVQIFCDFSAYSDIARGLSRMMGVELMVNFNVPYVATNPREFWRRWHISLSTWLRDYLYVSLGGNRGGARFVYRNLMLTMVLGGLWHGARANFIWWGVYQGALLCVHRAIEPRLQSLEPEGRIPRRVFRFACWLVFFHLVCYGWLLFRVETNAQLVGMTGALLRGWSSLGEQAKVLLRIGFFAGPLVLVQYFQVRDRNLLAPLTWRWPLRWALYLALFYLTTVFGAFDVIEFIYFQF